MADQLKNAQPFTFTTKGGTLLDLYGQLLGMSVRSGNRLVSHEYVKRDGGEVELTGARQRHFVYRCCLMGSTLTERWKSIDAAIRRDPKGKLVDIRLGSLNAACEGVDAQEDPETALDLLNFTISFIEDAVDTATVLDSDIGPQQRAATITDALNSGIEKVNAIVSNRIANAVYSAAVAAQADYATWAGKFRDTALLVAQSGATDPSLQTLLGRVLTKRDAVLTALVATLAKTLEPDVSLTDARTQIYVAFASCQQLYAAVLSQLPPIVPFDVPAYMTRNQILVRLYGSRARTKAETFDRLNRLPTPHWVPPQRLWVEAPLV